MGVRVAMAMARAGVRAPRPPHLVAVELDALVVDVALVSRPQRVPLEGDLHARRAREEPQRERRGRRERAVKVRRLQVHCARVVLLDAKHGRVPVAQPPPQLVVLKFPDGRERRAALEQRLGLLGQRGSRAVPRHHESN